MKEINKVIARNLFYSLILDYDLEGYASGRILNDGNFVCNIVSNSVENLVEKFYRKEY